MAILNKILTDVQVRILLHGKLGTKKYGASRDLTCAIVDCLVPLAQKIC